MKIKDIALCGVLTALALALSVLERMVPIGLLLPLPGVKLGLANIVILYTLLRYGTSQALLVTLLKTLLLLWITGNATALAMSICGGTLAFCAMALGARGHKKIISLWGISVLGAIFHNIGQVIAAMAISGTVGFVHLLAPLMISAVIFGSISALLTKTLLKKLIF